MINQYKVIIHNKRLYREIEIPFDSDSFVIGTEIDCDCRLRKELFFESIRLSFVNSNDAWSITCSDNLYITVGDSRKMLTKQVQHGEVIDIKYQNSDHEVFELQFMIDFDSAEKRLERFIDLHYVKQLSIGVDKGNNIVINSQYLYQDKIVLKRVADGLQLSIHNTTYGVYRNGDRVEDGCIINNGDFFSLSEFMFYYRDELLWTEISSNCNVQGIEFVDAPNPNNYPHFTRNTRIQESLSDEKIEILDPPSKPNKPSTHILQSLLPSMGMLLASGVMASMGGTMIIFSAVSGGMAIVTTLIGVIQNKIDFKKQISERKQKYQKYIENKSTEIKQTRENEKEILERIYISQEDELHKIREFSSELFDRRPTDSDFLCVRLGKGNCKAKREINYKQQERLEVEDELQMIPRELFEQNQMLQDVPIVCNLKDNAVVGVVGEKDSLYVTLKNLIFDIALRHFSSEVRMALVVEESEAAIAERIRFIPHFSNAISTRNIACDDDSKKVLFENLYNELSKRKESKDKKTQLLPHIVLLLYDLAGFNQHPISRFVDEADQLGVSFVFFANMQSAIPMGCKRLITLADERHGDLIDTIGEQPVVSFEYDSISDSQLEEVSRRLAAVVTEEVSLEGSLTKNINLFTLLNIFSVDDLDLAKRWNSTAVYQSMAVPLGVSKTGVVYLDLHDKAHGPHGLVAGTTGSGKSEILQTYILSVATLFHPYEIAFLIIDFKGGGMVNQFRKLPHLIGAITNIDGKQINRSLKSIKAELQKRQRLFAAAEVNHIDKYIKKYKEGMVKEPLPHLIIIVDEFAELRAEQPEFMKELISAARIGRSLGVHLILATQKPAGQVDNQIWSNSRFKLCLKVQGPEDSNEMLKTPLAAEIKEPGRAYLQVGNNEIFELFQSAYSGDSETSVDSSVKPFSIHSVSSTGKRKVLYEQKSQSSDKRGRTQLDAIVQYVDSYCEQSGIRRLDSICLPALERVIPVPQILNQMEDKRIDIGILDDPDNQYQGHFLLDVANKHTFVIGSSQYGKTNFLQLLIREIGLMYSPTEANIYILDFGSMVLKTFEKLKHVGGVVCSSDDEKLRNLFKLLISEINTRKEKMVSVGVSSFNAYCEAGYTDLPRIFVLVDNMTALMELYLGNDDTFLAIIREGLAVGISITIANANTTGISFRYLSNFANRIALYCNDSNEYNHLFERTRMYPDDVPGRCILEENKRILECQTYLAFDGEKEFERATAIREFVEECNERYQGQKAKAIPYIPNIMTNAILREDYKAIPNGYQLPIGLTYSEVEPFYMDFATLGAIGICGKQNRGHYNFISNILETLASRSESNPVKVYIFDDMTRKYKALKQLDIVSLYSIDPSDVTKTLSEWKVLLEERYRAMVEEREPKDNSLLFMIVQNNDVARVIQKDMDLMNIYASILGQYKSLNVCMIFSNYDNASVSYDAPEPLKAIKAKRHLLYLDDLTNLKVFDVPYEDIKQNRKKLQVGDAYYINDNLVTKLRLVKSEYNDNIQ